MLSTAGKRQHVSLYHIQRHNMERLPDTQGAGGAEGFSSDQWIPSDVLQDTEGHT